MSSDRIAVRREESGDEAGIRRVVEAAFGQPGEADLVDRLRENGRLTLSIVAEREGEVVGHVAFSPVTIAAHGSTIPAVGLGPMAVVPSQQRTGIGGRIIRYGLGILTREGHRIVVVLAARGKTLWGRAQGSSGRRREARRARCSFIETTTCGPWRGEQQRLRPRRAQ